jgi:hypothetical protein
LKQASDGAPGAGVPLVMQWSRAAE